MSTTKLTIKHGLSRALFTKYLPPSEHRPSRIKAFDWDGNSVIVSKQYDGDNRDHAHAIEKLCEKMGWTGELVSGGGMDGGMVFVFTEGAQ